MLFDHLGDAYMKNGLATEAIAAWEKVPRWTGTAPPRRGEEEDPGRAGEAAPGQGWRAQGRAEVAGARGRRPPALSPPVRSAACASGPAPPPLSAEASGAGARIEEQAAASGDLRTPGRHHASAAGGRAQRLSGVLLLLGHPPRSASRRSPPSACPFSSWPAIAQSVTLWEVLDNRAYLLPASPDANRRWLGLALGAEDLVAILSGQRPADAGPAGGGAAAPRRDRPLAPPAGADGEQRIWLDPAAGRRARWSGRGARIPPRVTFTPRRRRTAPPAGFDAGRPSTASSRSGRLPRSPGSTRASTRRC